jgi:hypothetical protein
MNDDNLAEAFYARGQLDTLAHELQRCLVLYSGRILNFQRAYAASQPENALSALQMLRSAQVEIELKLTRALELMQKLFPNEVKSYSAQRPPTA